MGMGAKLKERESKGSSSRLYLILNELKINVNDRNALNIWVLLLTTSMEDKSTRYENSL